MSKPANLLAVLAACAAMNACATDAPPDDGMSDRRPGRLEAREFRAGTGAPLPYRLYSPSSPAASAPLPLVLFLHGSGERGDDNDAQMVHGVREFLKPERQELNPCFVVAPQCPAASRWVDDAELDRLAALVEAVIRDAGGAIDTERIYLTGLSMGGQGAWHLAARMPHRFAALLPICGRVDPRLAPDLVGLPTWVFHGEVDSVVPVGQTSAMVEALRSAGGDPRVTIYDGVDHDSWTRTYADDTVHAWLFAQRGRR